VAEVLDDLAAQGLQSDERFVEGYVSQRVGRGYGPLHIRAELRERGIDDALTARWLDDVDHPWSEILGEALAGRFGSEPPSDRKELARQARYLERRGFPADLIRRRLFD
jgi:regulatory protein